MAFWSDSAFGAVAFVLLIACATVTSLFLSRATRRQRDFTLRAALGARRVRLARLLLVESLVLSVRRMCDGSADTSTVEAVRLAPLCLTLLHSELH
jgi:hypothetical protein